MTCLHCHEDHEDHRRDWPKTWNQASRLEFLNKMVARGVTVNFIPSMAYELDKLIACSTWDVSDNDLCRYLDESAVVAGKVRRIDEYRRKKLAWVNRISGFLIHHGYSNARTAFGLLGMVVLAIPLGIITAPVRVACMVGRWWSMRGFHATFVGWLKVNGRPKK